MKYHVSLGMPGSYLPDWTDAWDSEADARDAAAAQILDLRSDGWRVRTVEPGRCWALTNPDAGPHHLGFVLRLERQPCDDQS